ncbi:MAG: beta-galactosidase [Tannerellaceae bacterium]|nr:beta-galactosidase [Tannerellaceae bacterium]
MNRTLFYVLWFAVGLVSCTTKDKGGELDLGAIAGRNPEVAVVAGSEVFQGKTLHINPEGGNKGLLVWEKGEGQKALSGKYLALEVYGDNEFSGVITFEFYREEDSQTAEQIVLQSGEQAVAEGERPRLSALVGILPRLKTKMVFPLSYLDAQTLFLPRYPRQLKGTVSGNRLALEDVSKIVIRFGPYSDPHFRPVYEIASVALCDSVPQPYPAADSPEIDVFGQWMRKDWPGKIRSEEELKEINLGQAQRAISTAALPSDWSRYGGWMGKRFDATGFFRTHHDGARWWLVDPEGYGFLSVGVDCMRRTSSGPVNGIEDLFEWLPNDGDKLYSEAINRGDRGVVADFYVANLIRVFGSEWKSRWLESTAAMMRQLRFNTVGNWSEIEFARYAKIPYVLPLQRFPSTKVQLYRDFPDVFADEYRENAVRFAAQLEEYKDDPYLIGYFLRNEPEWAFGYHNLAYEMFGDNRQSVTKDRFITWLEERYGTVDKLNSAWKLSLQSFSDLKQAVFKSYPSEAADKDCYEFSVIMVGMYVDIACDEVKKIDSNHLNLGMRYAWLSSDLLYKAGERFDVFSINGYGINPPPTAEIARISGKPVMIGEFHHGATDRALPATGITGVLTQEDRASAYRNYIEQGFARPELIGMHYFQWVDQPYYGRFDGENYNIGIVTQTNIPYQELSEAAITTNERIYKVASGLEAPYKANLTIVPPIHY